MDRRAFLHASFLSALGIGGRGFAWKTMERATRGQDDDLARVDVIQAKARQAGLEEFGVLRGDSYIAVGNADASFVSTALKLCDALAKDFLKHFTDRKFKVTRPAHRMLVVILADPNDFASFMGDNPGSDVRGLYDLDAGWLAIPDNRGGPGGPRAERANSIVLFHEATHQLCFESGLLNKLADIPLCVSEGLATYGETRRPDGRTAIGARNNERIAVLRTLFDRAHKQQKPLTPLADLLVNDALLNEPETQQLAYAQSWSLIHMLMQASEDQTKLAAYLEQLKTRKDASKRLEDCEKHLGKPADLDERLKSYVAKLAKR